MIDVTELAEPGRLARELDKHPEGLAVGERGRVIGTIMPKRERADERDIERRLDAIPVYGVDGSPLPDGRMTPEQVEELLDIIGSMRQIDTDAMHCIVEEGRQMSIQMQLEEQHARDGH